MPSPLADPSPPLGIGLAAMVLLLAWGLPAVPAERRGAVARIVGTHVGVTTAALGGLSILVSGSVGGGANPFIGRVIQVFVSVAVVTLVSVIAIKGIGDLRRQPQDAAEPGRPAEGEGARPRASGARLVLTLFGMFAAFLVLIWLVVSSAPR